VKVIFDLNLKFFIPFVEFSFHQFVDKHAVLVLSKNLTLNLSVTVTDEVQNVFVVSAEYQCKMQKTKVTDWKTGAA